MEIDTKYFEQKIDEELALVERELATVGRRNPANKDDWEPAAADEDGSQADPNESADKFEELVDNAGILNELEIRYKELKDAKARIAAGTYGVCEVSGEPIERERLEANPAARTCLKHTQHRK